MYICCYFTGYFVCVVLCYTANLKTLVVYTPAIYPPTHIRNTIDTLLSKAYCQQLHISTERKTQKKKSSRALQEAAGDAAVAHVRSIYGIDDLFLIIYRALQAPSIQSTRATIDGEQARATTTPTREIVSHPAWHGRAEAPSIYKTVDGRPRRHSSKFLICGVRRVLTKPISKMCDDDVAALVVDNGAYSIWWCSNEMKTMQT